MVQLSHPYMTMGKTTALTTWTFVSKVMSLLLKGSSDYVKLSAKELMLLNYGVGEDS